MDQAEQFAKLKENILEQIDMSSEVTDEHILSLIDEQILAGARKSALTVVQKASLRKELYDSLRKLDALQSLLDDDEVTEIMINGYSDIFIEKNGLLMRTKRQFSSKEKLDDVIQQIVGSCNRVVNEQTPIVDARLENGARVNVILYPVALNGPILTIRRFPEEPITMKRLIAYKSLTEEAADYLRQLVCAGYSIMIGGGTGCGKTTFLNALSNYIPARERVITIEDTAELQIQNVANLVRLESRAANMEGSKAITMDDLIKSALRMRPDRIVVGEIRGAEAKSYITSLNLGHEGCMATAHANSAREMLTRVEMMVLMGMEIPLPAIRRQIASGLEILIHLERDRTGRRRVREIAEVEGIVDEQIRLHTLFTVKDDRLVRTEELMHTEKMEKAEAAR